MRALLKGPRARTGEELTEIRYGKLRQWLLNLSRLLSIEIVEALLRREPRLAGATTQDPNGYR